VGGPVGVVADPGWGGAVMRRVLALVNSIDDEID
jgi:hypothetical protein